MLEGMKRLGLAVLILATTACGGGSSVSSGQDVADMIGCTGWADDTDEMFVTEGGPCDLDGEEVWAYYFASNEARDSYLEVAVSFGGQYLVGDGFAVQAPPATLEALKGEHGGKIEP